MHHLHPDESWPKSQCMEFHKIQPWYGLASFPPCEMVSPLYFQPLQQADILTRLESNLSSIMQQVRNVQQKYIPDTQLQILTNHRNFICIFHSFYLKHQTHSTLSWQFNHTVTCNTEQHIHFTTMLHQANHTTSTSPLYINIPCITTSHLSSLPQLINNFVQHCSFSARLHITVHCAVLYVAVFDYSHPWWSITWTGTVCVITIISAITNWLYRLAIHQCKKYWEWL